MKLKNDFLMILFFLFTQGSVSETADQRTRQTEKSEFLHGLRDGCGAHGSLSPNMSIPWLFGPLLSARAIRFAFELLVAMPEMGQRERKLLKVLIKATQGPEIVD